MKTLKAHKHLITIALIVPLIAAIFTVVAFAQKGKQTLSALYEEKVEGESTTKLPESIAKDIPMLPGSEISSFDTSNETISLAIETNTKEADIKKFYDEYFKKNGWKRVKLNTYQKDNKSMNYQIAGNIVKIVIFK
ncbi:MAG: hypothetical protein E6Q58_04265 [Niabella sp.]|nr:MAG: hypothetical protein E6Q58_04265 [Niabella sp.]